MADIDLNQDHVQAGAEALQREDWANNRPLSHYVPFAETVLEAAELEAPVDVVTAWLDQDGLLEEMAKQVASAEGLEWAGLHDDEQAAYREGADSLITLIKEYEA